LSIDHVSSSALAKPRNISSISLCVTISGGQNATMSPGMLRRITP
jgi:hypothetical protein